MADSWGYTIAAGIIDQPQSVPVKLTIEYSNGSALALTGDSLRSFWQELTHSLLVTKQVYFNLLKQQEQQREVAAQQEALLQGPSIPAEALRKHLNMDLESLLQRRNKEEDTEEE